MKTIIVTAASVMLAGFIAAYPQDDTSKIAHWKQALSDNDEYLHALSVLDKNVMENAKVLIHNIETKRSANYEIAKNHSAEIARSLAASENYLTRLEKATDQALDAMQLGYLADFHQHYRKAIEEQLMLQEELIKASPAKSVIVMKAKAIYAEMEKAGKEQIDLDLKMEIKEPGVPVQKR